MERDDIDKMPSGQEMNSLIFELMEGRKPQFSGNEEDDDYVYMPNYSKDIGAAWRVVDKFFTEYDIWSSVDDEDGNRTDDALVAVEAVYKNRFSCSAYGCETPALAICRAVLHAQPYDLDRKSNGQ